MTIMKKHILALAGLLAGAMMATSCSQARLDEVEHLGVTEVDKTYAEANDMTAQQLIANVYSHYHLYRTSFFPDYIGFPRQSS